MQNLLNNWNKYQEARSNVDDFLKKGSDTLKSSLELLGLERSKINRQLIGEWIYFVQNEIPDFYSYVNLENISDKLGRAYSRYWHYVFLYRALYENKNNIVPNKVYSFELYFLSKEKVLEKAIPEINIPGDRYELNQSQRLFYLSPLGHFLFFKFTKEYVFKFAPKTEIAQEMMVSSHWYENFCKVRDGLADKFIEFFSELDINHCQPNTFREFVDQDSNLSKIFNIIDTGINATHTSKSQS